MIMSCGENNHIKDEMNDEVISSDSTVNEVSDIVAEAILSSKSGSEAEGKVIFTEQDGIVTMQVKLINTKPVGPHAMHIHAIGDCSSEDGKSAGGHWNPTDTSHGKWGHKAYHKGDIGNIDIKDDFTGEFGKSTDEWCLTCSDSTKNIIGKSIIVHKGLDDMKSQPSGNAGSRIACGEILLVG